MWRLFFMVCFYQLLWSSSGGFDANGRLTQVDYAYQATMKAGTLVATKAKDSIVIISIVPKLHDYAQDTERIVPLNPQTYVCGTGVSADVRYLTNKIFETSVEHSVTFGSPMPLERMAEEIASLIHQNTFSDDSRPYGASLIFFGKGAKANSLKIIEIDPFGSMHDCLVSCVGCYSKEILKGLPKERNPLEMNRTAALQFLFESMNKAFEENEKTANDFLIQVYEYQASDHKLQAINLKEIL